MFLFQLTIFLVCYRLAPLIGCLLARYFHCQMAEPAIRCSAMPMLNLCRNVDAVARFQFDCFLALFLIISTSGYAYKNLSATALCMMDMPVVPALNWTPPPQSLVVASFNGIHICALCESFLTSSFYQVIFLFLPRSKPLLQG